MAKVFKILLTEDDAAYLCFLLGKACGASDGLSDGEKMVTDRVMVQLGAEYTYFFPEDEVTKGIPKDE
jgi:hypothetical protein